MDNLKKHEKLDSYDGVHNDTYLPSSDCGIGLQSEEHVSSASSTLQDSARSEISVD